MSENKNKLATGLIPWLKRWGVWIILLCALNICCIFWIVGEAPFRLFGTSNQTEESTDAKTDFTEAIDASTQFPTEEMTEEEMTEAAELIVYPEGAIKIDSYEEKMNYVRNWYLAAFHIPDELGDSCDVYVKLPELNRVNGTWSGYVESMAQGKRPSWGPALYFLKEDQYYVLDCSLSWEEEILVRAQRTVYLNDPAMLFLRRLKNVDSIADRDEKGYLQISGKLSQEIYVQGQPLDTWKWGGLLQIAGFWQIEQTGQCFGPLKGDIYVRDYSTGECWVCLEGLEPVKVIPPEGDDSLLTEAPIAVDGVKFTEKEKAKAQAKLSFDLTLEKAEGVVYPEDAIKINSYEEKMTYFRNWYLGILEIPKELGNSCHVSVRLPELNRTSTIWEHNVQQRQQGVPLYCFKDNQYYCQSGSLISWDEGFSLDRERTVYLDYIHVSSVWPEFKKVDSPKYSEYEKYYLQISGELSHEIYPAGKDYYDQGANPWNGELEAAGFWQLKHTGECFGAIKGDIYVMNVQTGECWICLDGFDPVKTIIDLSGGAAQAPTPMEGVEFTEEEKARALARLSFDLMVEALGE